MSKVIASPQLTFVEALQEAKGKLIDWKGRSRRSEFWWCVLCAAIVSCVLNLIPIIGQLLGFVVSLIMIPLGIRRLHDTGRNGWWLIACIVLSMITSYYYMSMLFSAFDGGEMVSIKALMRIFTNPLLIILYLVTLVLSIVLLVFFCQDSKVEPNKWGKSPKYNVVEDHVKGEAYQKSDLDKAIDNMGDKIDEMTGKAQDVADDAFDKAKDFADDAVDKAKDFAGDTIDKAKDIAGDAVDKMKEMADGVKEAAEDAVEKAKDAIKKD